jgi:hypothetical protein
VVDRKTGDSGTKDMGKNRDGGGQSSAHNPGKSSSEGGSNKPSGRDRTKSGNGRS